MSLTDVQKEHKVRIDRKTECCRGSVQCFPDVDQSDKQHGRIPRCWVPKYLEGVTDDACPICMQNFLPTGELVLALSCGHHYHPECIWKYLFSNGDCNLTANGGDGVVPTAMGLCSIDSTKTCPMCRAPPGGDRSRSDRAPAPDPVSTKEMMAGVGEVGADILKDALFKLSLTRSLMRTIIPCKPCLAEHQSGYWVSKFCYSCAPSCKICCRQRTKLGPSPFWRAKDAGGDCDMFCDKCFWLRISLLGHVRDAGRFERLEASALLRPRFLTSGAGGSGRGGCLKDVSGDGQELREESECEKCGEIFDNYWIFVLEQWCSKCSPAPKAKPKGQPIAIPAADPVPSEPVTPIVLGINLPTWSASPGFLAPRPTRPASPASVPPPDTTPSSSTEVSGDVPNSKPAAETEPGSPKLEPNPKRKPKKRKSGPEREMLQTEIVGQNGSSEVGSVNGSTDGV